MSDWNPQRIEQFAPDGASLKAAQGLAKPGSWQSLGRTDRTAWGECKGSGANPYQVRVDLVDAAYKCSCPSRKLPCKHTLGLLLLFVGGLVPTGTPPAFVDEWQENRSKRAETKAAKASALPAPVDEAAQQKRAAKREARVEAGLQLLEAALADLIAQGLAAARSQPHAFWSQLAGRLVDAQAPGLARRIFGLGDRLVARGDWQSVALAEMSKLQLLIDAYRRIAGLPEDLAAELRTLVGYTQDQKELLARTGIRDRWLVAGREHSEEGNMRVSRTWLVGCDSSRPALLLDFAVGNQPLPATLTLGQCLDAELVYFDGVPPLRALLKERVAAPSTVKMLPLGTDILAMLNAFASRLATNPWLERWPTILGPVTPLLANQEAVVADASGRTIALDPSTQHADHLLALSGGRELTLFGTFDGAAFLPLSVALDDDLFGLGTLESLAILSKVA